MKLPSDLSLILSSTESDTIRKFLEHVERAMRADRDPLADADAIMTLAEKFTHRLSSAEILGAIYEYRQHVRDDFLQQLREFAHLDKA